MSNLKSFEETYGTYPFRPLVAFGLALSNLLVRARDPRAEATEKRQSRA